MTIEKWRKENPKLSEKYPRLTLCCTVGELARELKKLPQDLNIKDGDGICPIVFNVQTHPTLMLEENDGTWDDACD